MATRSRGEVHTSLQGLQVFLALSAMRHTEELPHTLDCRQHTSWLTASPIQHTTKFCNASILSQWQVCPLFALKDVLVGGDRSTCSGACKT